MSPIRIVGDILVANLTIEPGVDVVFMGDYEINVGGQLTAVGEEDARIHFRGDSGITWKRMLFQNTAADDILRWCLIENANISAVHIIDSYPKIENCEFANNTTYFAAGLRVLLETVSGILDLRECIFRNNSTSAHGGGAWIKAAAPECAVRFFDCEFIENISSMGLNVSAKGGGGAYVDGSVQFFRCLFDGNKVKGLLNANFDIFSGGGGLWVNSGHCYIHSTVFDANTVEGKKNGGSGRSRAHGGAIYVHSGASASISNSILINNIVTSATGHAYGGGIYVYSNARVEVENTTIAANTTEGINATETSTLTVHNSILWGNNNNGNQIDGYGNVTVNYSNVQNGFTGTGNMNSNPVFNPDYSISRFSPLIDKGNPDPAYNDLCFYDPDTTPWGSYGTARNDMGAHGGPGACLWQPGTTGAPVIVLVTGGGRYRYGATITLAAGVAGIPPFTYAWSKNGQALANDPPRITGADAATLTILNAGTADAGVYTVAVDNDYTAAPVTSGPVTVEVSELEIDLKMFAGVIIWGQPGKPVRVEYTNDLSSGSWATLAEFVLPKTPHIYYDEDSINHPRRFYRAVSP